MCATARSLPAPACPLSLILLPNNMALGLYSVMWSVLGMSPRTPPTKLFLYPCRPITWYVSRPPYSTWKHQPGCPRENQSQPSDLWHCASAVDILQQCYTVLNDCANNVHDNESNFLSYCLDPPVCRHACIVA